MRYDEMVFVSGLRVKAINHMDEDKSFIDLVSDAPGGAASFDGVLRWYCGNGKVLHNARIDDRLALLAPGGLFDARAEFEDD